MKWKYEIKNNNKIKYKSECLYVLYVGVIVYSIFDLVVIMEKKFKNFYMGFVNVFIDFLFYVLCDCVM